MYRQCEFSSDVIDIVICNPITMLTSSGAVTFVHNQSLRTAQLWFDFLCVLHIIITTLECTDEH